MPKAISNENFSQIWSNIKNLLNGKVDKEAGKGLSSNDFTSVYRATLDNLSDTIDQKITNRILQAFPVGTIIETKNSTNPSSYIGGTWAQYGAGQVTVGIDPSDPDFDTIEKTGGSKEMQQHSHSATAASNGAHTHTGTAASAGSHNHSASSNSAGSHTHGMKINKSQVEASGYSLYAGSGGFMNRAIILRSNYELYSSSGGSHSHTITVNSGGAHTHSVTTNSAGAHTHTIKVDSAGTGNRGNLQPYITVYRWIRTS